MIQACLHYSLSSALISILEIYIVVDLIQRGKGCVTQPSGPRGLSARQQHSHPTVSRRSSNVAQTNRRLGMYLSLVNFLRICNYICMSTCVGYGREFILTTRHFLGVCLTHTILENLRSRLDDKGTIVRFFFNLRQIHNGHDDRFFFLTDELT